MMQNKEKFFLPIINFARRHFRNTWIHRIPITSWIYQKLFAFTYKGIDKEIVFRGSRYLVPTKDNTVVPSMISGEYEKYELDLFGKLLKNGDVVLDVGANIGTYCIEASKKIGKKGRVFTFEPIAENQKLLAHNLKLNDIQNVTMVNKAIGIKDTTIKIYKAKNSIATHTAGAISDDYEEAEVTSIDSFVKNKRLSVDLVKMDIEGYEGYAIEGGQNTLRQQKPLLFIEFSSHHLKQCGYNPKEHAKNLLNIYDYCYLIDEKKHTIIRLRDEHKIAGIYNGNLILSSRPLDIH